MTLTTQLDKLLDSISDFYNKVSSSIVYKIMKTTANELDSVDSQITQLHEEVRISTATGSALDSHGEDLDVFRIVGESDDDYRARLIKVFSSSKVTRQSILELVSSFIVDGSGVVVEDYVLDRWMLGPEYFQNRVIDEYQLSVSSTVVDLSSGVPLAATRPEVFLATDTTHEGTEYFGDLGTFGENPLLPGVGRLFLENALPMDNTAVLVSYTSASTAGAFFDTSYSSFLGKDTILRNDNIQNNFTLSDQTTAEITISTRRDGRYSGYPVKVDWFDVENNHIYSWYTVTEETSGILRLDNSNKIDSKSENEVCYSTGTSVETSMDISGVIGVYSDTFKLFDYAPSKNFLGNVIILDTPYPSGQPMIVAYYGNPISDYRTVPFDRLSPTGDGDIKLTFEVRINSDPFNEAQRKQQLDVGDVVYGGKAAGTRAFVRLVAIYESKYGLGKYGESVYGFMDSF